MATPPVFSAGAVLTAAQMNAVGTWLVKTQTVGTSVATVELTSVFSADFDSYRVSVENVDCSVGSVAMKLTFGATAGTAYSSTSRFDNYDGLSTGFGRINGGAYIGAGYTSTTDDLGMEFTIISPFLAKRTLVMGQYVAGTYAGWFDGLLANTTSYTAFTLAPASGTMTGGTIKVYGNR